MKIDKPTYLIAELVGDVVPMMGSLRERFNPSRTQWPVDITIAGSSGKGTIAEGQYLSDVINLLSPVISEYGFTEVNFTSINRFPNTGIYYLSPEREQFDIIHGAVVNSGILFNDNKWPYTPHCTLRAGPSPTEECDALFGSIRTPKDVKIECFGLYQPEPGGGVRIHRF